MNCGKADRGAASLYTISILFFLSRHKCFPYLVELSIWTCCPLDMDLLPADTAVREPKEQLERAIHEYETVLSDEDRKQLHSQGSPDAMAAINLTAEIDRRCNNRRSQCIGPRLITFLESIQQFSQVVDTFVSSHPQLAALVWGGVKLALLV